MGDNGDEAAVVDCVGGEGKVGREMLLNLVGERDERL